MKKLFTLIILVAGIKSFAQIYPINTYEFGWTHRNHFKQLREIRLVNNPDGTITAKGGMLPYEKFAVTNSVLPCYMTLSITDMLMMRHSNEEKTIRFGDLIGLNPIYAGSAKYYDMNGEDKTTNFGTGFFVGGFLLYHYNKDMGIGFNYKWDVTLDGIINHKSFYSYYEPISYYSLLFHYKMFSLEFSTTLSKEPDVQDMIDDYNERIAKKNYTHIGNYHHPHTQILNFKYLFYKKKMFLAAKFEFLRGDWYTGNEKDFALFRRDKFNTTTITFGYAF